MNGLQQEYMNTDGHNNKLQVDAADEQHILEPFVVRCTSESEVYWVGGMLVYKGILLLFGIFLAWETRNIRVDALNDSKHIGFCVYNTAVICLIGVPFGFVMGEDNYEVAYVIKSLFVILCTTVTLCIVFVPKMYSLYHNPSGDVNMRFETGNNSTLSVPRTGQNQIHAMSFNQMKENIGMQKRLENALKEKDKRIKELETALSEVGQSSSV